MSSVNQLELSGQNIECRNLTASVMSEHRYAATVLTVDVRGSVHHNTNRIETANKMQLCRTVYYSSVS